MGEFNQLYERTEDGLNENETLRTGLWVLKRTNIVVLVGMQLSGLVCGTMGDLITPAFAQDARIQQALQEITDTAGKICQTAPLDQTTQQIKVSGDVKLDLQGMLKKLANIGFGIGGQYETGKSVGVLQKDLIAAIESGNSCKLEVFRALERRLLKDDLTDETTGTSPKTSLPEQPTQGSISSPKARVGPSELEFQATQFAHAFVQAGAAPPDDAMNFFSKHYAPTVNYFQHSRWHVSEVLEDKRAYVYSRSRSYNLLPGLSAVCKESERRCVINGLVEYKTVRRSAISCGRATLERLSKPLVRRGIVDS